MKTCSPPTTARATRGSGSPRSSRASETTPTERKEAALKWSVGRGTKGFAIPVEVELEAKDGRGLSALARRIKRGRTYPELALRRRYNERRDAVEIETVIHRRVRERVEAVRIGILPEMDAAWVRPLLRRHLPLKTSSQA